VEAPVAIVLAAGKGTRMKSALPKVLHEICGRPMVEYVLDAACQAGVKRLVVVVGHAAETVRETLGNYPGVEFALQAEQKGTGHAVMMCRENLAGHNGPVFVLTGDAPLMRSESFAALLTEFRDQRAACVIGTAETEANFGLGRIVRSPAGEFLKIVEQKDATPEEAAITEINVGCYVFDSKLLFEALTELQPNNKQGEYYLTDCAAILKHSGHRVIAAKKLDIREALGVNTRAQMVDIHRTMQREWLDQLLVAGVTIVEPAQTYIDLRARIGEDTVIHPFTSITGPAVIGRDCRIGPHVVVEGSARIPDATVIEPFQQIR
jgi:bifunctional UDP-N-acetylglucosamine pyrophosphorylase/glucosamine-1-phosphate N-acetyltransferase